MGKLLRLWSPPPELTVSEWADQERRLSPESSAKPGKYSTSYTEYARGPMDAFNDPKVRVVVGMFSAQTSKTTIIENVVGYFAQHDPCPIMVVEPTLEIAEAMSKDRFSAMIRDTPALRERFSPAGSKSSGDTLLHKKFPGGSLTLAGANSYNSLASRPIRIAIGDEASKWQPNEKGSPIRQLSARVKGFWNSKRGFFSTPTTADEENEFYQLWEQSDQQLFFCPCECGEDVVFTFDASPESIPAEVSVSRAVLRLVEGEPSFTSDGRKIRRANEAWFECVSCGRRIDDVERRRMVRRGRWRATKDFHGIAGYWGWQAMSPFESAEALNIANEWLSALGSQATLQSVKNETLGLPWAIAGDAPEWKRIYDRREGYSLCLCPAGVLFVTAGADVQKDRIEVQFVGWGRGKESWLIDYEVIDGDTSKPEIWARLGQCLGRTYRHVAGVDLPVIRFAIDSGFATQEVYAWSRKQSPGRVMVVKGQDHGSAVVGQPSAVDVDYQGKKVARGASVWPINSSTLKSELYGWLRLDSPTEEEIQQGARYPAGYCHFPQMADEFFKQLVAEQLVSKIVKGYRRSEWQKTRERNEALDTRVYARAAASIFGIDRFQDQQWNELEFRIGRMAAPVAPTLRQPKETQASNSGERFSVPTRNPQSRPVRAKLSLLS